MGLFGLNEQFSKFSAIIKWKSCERDMIDHTLPCMYKTPFQQNTYDIYNKPLTIWRLTTVHRQSTQTFNSCVS
jgi:hypothetical protein